MTGDKRNERAQNDTGRKGCLRYRSCCVQLCPRAPSSLAHSTWFPDEPICDVQQPGGMPRFIKVQKAIRRCTGGKSEAGFFTCAMLEALDRVKPGIRGIDPDSFDQRELIAKWVKSRRRRPLSLEEKARLARMGSYALLAWRKTARGAALGDSTTKEASGVENAAGGLRYPAVLAVEASHKRVQPTDDSVGTTPVLDMGHVGAMSPPVMDGVPGASPDG